MRLAMITFGFLLVAQTVRAYESAYPMTEVGVCEIKTLPAGVVLRARSEKEYFRENNGLFRKLFEAIQQNQVPMTTPVEAGIRPGTMVGEEGEIGGFGGNSGWIFEGEFCGEFGNNRKVAEGASGVEAGGGTLRGVLE
jgi:hypothetical protein